MNNHDRPKQTDLLVRCILHDDTGELQKYEQRIAESEGCLRCLRRAITLMLMVTSFSVAGFGFSWVLLKDFATYYIDLTMHVFRVLGTASLLSLLSFGCIWLVQRRELGIRREACRTVMLGLLGRTTVVPPVTPIAPASENVA